MVVRSIRLRLRTVIKVLCALALVAGAGSLVSAGAASAAQAKGSPIKMGLINQENDPAGDFTPVDVGLTAAVKYINDSLGGIAGRPIVIDKCITSSTANGDTCAEQMVHDHVLMVAGGVNLTGSEIYPVLKKAGIPFIGEAAVSPADLQGDGNHFFMFGGSLAEFPAEAATIVKSGDKNMVLFVLDGTGGQLVQSLLAPVFKAAGVKMTIVTADGGSADFTSQLTIVKADNPQAIMVAFVPPACTKILQESPSVGITVPTYYTGNCGTDQILASVGSAAKGAYFASEPLPLTDKSSQVTIFKKEMPGSTDPDNESGFGTMMDIYNIIKKAGGAHATSASIRKTVASSTNVAGFLGAPYSCGKPPLSVAPAVCNVGVRLIQASAKGTTTDVSGHWVSVLHA
jgi:branched-chain amino acid transport system substrate-binding protein